MKKNRLTRVFAVVLTVAMCMGLAVPASAAGWNSRGSWRDFWDDVFDGWKNPWSGWDNPWWGNGDGDGKDDSATGDSSSDGDTKLTLIEDQSTVADGVKLRASTYELTATGEDIKYFPSTLYNYDWAGVNAATRLIEAENAKANGTTIDRWKGIYFSAGKPLKGGGETWQKKYNSIGNLAEIDEGKTSSYSSTETLKTSYGSTDYTNYCNNNYYYYINGKYLLVTGISDSSYYFIISCADGKTYNTSKSTITLNKRTTSNATYSASEKAQYEAYNFWPGDISTTNGFDADEVKKYGSSTSDPTGNFTFSGLVKDTLDNGKIVFNEIEPGLFTTESADWKTVYTQVGIPFKYTESTNEYLFDSNTMGAYFTTDTPAVSNTNLPYSDTPQKITDLSVQSAPNNQYSWLPFTTSASTTTTNATYHFGMQTTIPFTMTNNGRVSSTIDDEIVFEFSGDDDVWVFIDGKLVLDIGGIHNEMSGKLNFAQNTWAVGIGDGNAATSIEVGDTNGKAMSGALFNGTKDGKAVTGILGTDLATFAAQASHTLTIFYLERGAGASNCKIKFNLPMNDILSVQKVVSNKDSKGYNISDDTMAEIDNVDFGFTLYKNGESVANATYTIYDKTGSYDGNGTTDSTGHFTLKNGYRAEFIGDIVAEGVKYYVVEDEETGYGTPTWTYTVDTANGYTQDAAQSGWTSQTVTAKGSNEKSDKVSYVCTNVMTHVDQTSLTPKDDTIVIDYGLPVLIDVLANDVSHDATGKVIDKVEIEGTEYGTAEIVGNKIKFTLTKQLTGVQVLEYTAYATKGTTQSETVTAHVYIIPATTMYYEENFGGMVTYSEGWSEVKSNEKQNAYQETGVVGTTDDSPYGSDVAYLNNSGDSYGTSHHVTTTSDSDATFSYTFTGTGTTFFARTSNQSGYMKVEITNTETNSVEYTYMRDTSYKVKGDDGKYITNEQKVVFYNIPVFTWTADGYGTYRVDVTIAGKGKLLPSMGRDFWLDGIKVFNPININDANYLKATSAYAQDGESSMTNITLRNKLLSGEYTQTGDDGELVWNTKDGFVLFTDTNGKIVSASEYKSNGPKEEVYLAEGQSVTFQLNNWTPNENKLFLGIKAPEGNGGTVKVNGHEIKIDNTVDCFYEISSYGTLVTDGTYSFKIENVSKNVISVTNVKVTGAPTFTPTAMFDLYFDGYEGEGEDIAASTDVEEGE